MTPLDPTPDPTPAVSADQASIPLAPEIAALLSRTDSGLVPAIVQDEESGRVLMLAWMDDEALRRTISTGRSTFWSRSRQAYWVKGETSGHTQSVRRIELDCDGDTLLMTVRQVGAACHTGLRSCFDSHTLLTVASSDE